jgi:CheY-like chemotaxis protein
MPPVRDTVHADLHALAREAKTLRTEVQALRSELLASRQRETSALDQARRLTSRLGHDLNNQLTIVSGYATLLIEDAAIDAALRRKLAEIAQASDRGRAIVQSLVGVVDGDVPEAPALVSGHDECVLVVDDEPSVLRFMQTVLGQLRYRAVSADSPAEAIRLVKEGLRPDLVITDVIMPVMHGRRLITELETLMSGFQVLYVSGYVPNTDRHDDAVHFLAKPFTSDVLARRVRELLDAKPLVRSAGL